MTVRSKTTVLATVLSVLAVGVLAGQATAADLPMKTQARAQSQNQLNQTSPLRAPSVKAKKSAQAKTQNDDVTGSISWPASARAGLKPAVAAVSYAHAARASFAKAQAAMERGLLLRKDAPKSNFATLEDATTNVLLELKALEQVTQYHNSEAIKKAASLVLDWHEAGLKIIKPPAQGVTALPFPVTVAAKAKAAVIALDQLIEGTDAFAQSSLAKQRTDLHIQPPELTPAPAKRNQTTSQ